MNRQSGFAVVELVVVVVLLAAVAGTGYYVMHVRSQKNQPTTATASSTPSGYQSPSVAAPVAPQVNSASDLNSAMQALNQTNVTASNTDSSQLSTQASGL